MSANSKIEWCDHTWNSWLGCTKVSPACDHCYAEVSTPSRTLGVTWGAGQERRRTSVANWNLPVRWNAQAEAFRAQHGRRQRVFCASLGDWLDNEVPIEWFIDLLDLIRRTANLNWLLLSKRIGNFEKRMREAKEAIDFDNNRELWLFLKAWLNGEEIPAHVWLGATICSQEEADRDIPKLLAVPAAKRFLSMEPLLGPVDLTRVVYPMYKQKDENDPYVAYDTLRGHMIGPDDVGLPKLDWVIVGGESGHQARPMHPSWARSLRDQCAAAGVPMLFKQWGEWAPVGTSPVHPESTRIPGNLCRVTLDGVTADHYVAISTNGGRERYEIRRVGKKAAGRLLDGVQHDGYPA